jgi:sulfonate transport system substrate-binding protein
MSSIPDRRSLSRRHILSGTAVLAASCLTTRHARAETMTLRVGDQRGGARALMEAADVLRDLPYRLEWSLFAGAPMLLEALNADAIDTGGIGDAPFAWAIESGVPMKAVGAVKSDGAVTALVVPQASAIRSVAELKGKQIGTLRGQTGHYLVLAALARAGMKPDDVRFVWLSPADAKPAMAIGAIDG